MKKILVVAGLLFSLIASAQDNTDSIRRDVNRDVRNSAVQAFTNLRLNKILLRMLDWIDSARAGEGGSLGIDQIQVLNDSTFRYRLNGVYTNLTLKGVYDSRRKMDTAYMMNDTLFRYRINGQNRTTVIRGASYARVINDTLITIGGDTIKVGGTGSGTAALDTIQTHTSGSTVTISNGVNILYVDPGSTLASLNITLPATPNARGRLDIYFGGTVLSGTAVVTSITITPNSGQAILQATTPSRVEAGEVLSYQYRISNLKWYRK